MHINIKEKYIQIWHFNMLNDLVLLSVHWDENAYSIIHDKYKNKWVCTGMLWYRNEQFRPHM